MNKQPLKLLFINKEEKNQSKEEINAFYWLTLRLHETKVRCDNKKPFLHVKAGCWQSWEMIQETVDTGKENTIFKS